MARTRFSALVVQDPKGPANKYDPEFCWTVRELAQEGMFPEEWCAHIGVTNSTLYNWANAHPDFEQAMHEAWWILRAYWTKMARDSIQGVGMAPSILAMILEKRFPDTWGRTNPRNTHETFTTRNDPDPEEEAKPLTHISDDDLDARIAALEQRLKDDG